jgi:tetratricopeptide (TPR) repeat protein
MNLDKLKEAARKFEQREEWRRAIDVYLKAIREAEDAGGEGTQDPALYNRVGDLEMKAGDSLAALRAYEQAAELYADQGFFNNAIALCGKILRVNPSRTATYLRLAQLHARKNFVGEAKKNLIEYLDRMNGVGQLEEAFSAVKLFADQFHANPDIRLMLVELLRASSRTEEAKEQLEKLASELEARGDATGARRTRERLHAIAEEKPGTPGARRTTNDLVFLDTGDRDSAKPVEPLEGLVASASEELVAEPANLAIDLTEHGAGALDASVAAGDALLDPGAVEATDPDWAGEVSQMEGLDLITADGVGGEEDTGTSDDLPMLDVDESAMPLGDEYGGDSTVWLVEEGPGAATLSGDSAADLEATEFDDVAATEPVPGDPGVPPPSRADTMYLQLEDMMAAADPFGGIEPGAALFERARQALDSGAREQGIAALEEALRFFESEGRWEEALRACGDLLHLDPGEIGRYQKQVEVAYRAGQRPVLVQAYLELADALVRMDAVDHATHVYQRVLEHDPGNQQARSALELLESMADLRVVMPPLPEPAPEEPRSAPVAQAEAPVQAPVPFPAPGPAPSGGEFVDLGALILDEQQVRDTRMRIGQSQPIEDEDQAFHEALAEFKRGIDANLEANDFQAHYDLGIAFKEMGLLDEAIAQFQKALRSPDGRLRTSEQLGAAFYAKGQYAICEAVLRRAVEGLPGADDEKIGLLYWLGRALEAQQRGRDALPLYERALAVDIRFLDLGERVERLGAEPSR